MIAAGIMEFILGNTFPMAVFIVYGSHWCNQGYINDPMHMVVASYTSGTGADAIPGGLSQAYNAGQGNYAVVLALVTFVFLCGSLRTNIPFVLVFFTIVFLFSFFAAAFCKYQYSQHLAYNTNNRC